WKSELAKCSGASFIEAHASWTYFADTFGLRIAGRLEPLPGVSPTPNHVAQLVEIGKRDDVKMVVGRPGYADVASRVAEAIGATAVSLPTASASSGEMHGWFEFMDRVVHTFSRALSKTEPADRGEASSSRG
ncbi:MAG: zinc ABC transporter substrate-binding protein, partial [Planctomycetes bacterium]|nr:zinc ABC transporter substrate-binding protein [Planctomycetota bacterium]